MSLLARHNADTTAHCVWCIDGWTPAGLHPALGPVYRFCPTVAICGDCADLSVFPADFHNPEHVAAALVGLGLAVVICPVCLGITAVIPLTNQGGIQ